MHNFPVIILMSGKRKSGKDFVAEKLRKDLSGKNVKISKIHLSEPLKRQYAALHNLDAENLLTSSEYKEDYRREMVIWGENIRRQNPSYFCRAAVDQCSDWAISDVKIVCDCRRPTDLAYFESNFASKDHRVLKLRIESDKKTRTSRGWTFTPNVDDSATEISLDDGVSWDFILNNNSSKEDFGREYAVFLESVLSRKKYKFTSWSIFNGRPNNIRYPRSSTAAVKDLSLANDSQIPWNHSLKGRCREFSVKNSAGACGYKLNSDYEQFAALHKKYFVVENLKNKTKTFSVCSQDACVQISNKFYVRVADICVGCHETDVDFSTAAFRKMWGLAAKVQEKVEWTLIKCSSKVKGLM